jgi:hypothetical protein
MFYLKSSFIKTNFNIWSIEGPKITDSDFNLILLSFLFRGPVPSEPVPIIIENV